MAMIDKRKGPYDINVMLRSSLQPRDTCYVATSGLTELTYSGYQPHAYSWDDYPRLKNMLDAVRMILIINSANDDDNVFD